MNDEKIHAEGSCECGKTRFKVTGEPLLRMYCHCTICQQFNKADFGDVTMLLSRDVEFHDHELVEFKQYKKPPAVDRGTCRSCNKPVIEFLKIPLMPELTIVPSYTLGESDLLPESIGHVYYETRIKEIDDELPKYSGTLSSQLVSFKALLPQMIRASFKPG